MALLGCRRAQSNWDKQAESMEHVAQTHTEALIESLDTADWVSEKIYESIRATSIDSMKSLSESQKISDKSMLGQRYAEQLVRTQKHILGSDCAPRHATLSAAHAEYAAREKEFGGYRPKGVAEVDSAFARHQRQMAFGVSSAYNVAMHSWREPYDASYDRRVRAEAAAIRATGPTCSEILRRTSETTVNEALARRRRNYEARREALRKREEAAAAAKRAKPAKPKSSPVHFI